MHASSDTHPTVPRPGLTLRLKALKNFPGWRTRRKLVVFNVDDYGNIRLASRAAGARLVQAGVALTGRFDQLDTLETRADLEALLEVLDSVRDSTGRAAVFTPYTLSANPDFVALRADPDNWQAEALPDSFARLAAEDPQAYEGAWSLWREGVDRGLLQPEFHGREHLNLRLLMRKLGRRDADVMANLQADSMVGLKNDPNLPGVGFTHAFGLADRSDLAQHREIIADGIARFTHIFGRQATCFTPPAQRLHPEVQSFVAAQGIRAIDCPMHAVQQIDRGRIRRSFHVMGRKRGQDHVTLVRNVMFEPNLAPGRDEVARALGLIEVAFRWGKPAMISSHRVNFCGHIDPVNRKAGLAALKRLLAAIIDRWPDAEFLGAGELAQQIQAKT
jgi:hypothetical protein